MSTRIRDARSLAFQLDDSILATVDFECACVDMLRNSMLGKLAADYVVFANVNTSKYQAVLPAIAAMFKYSSRLSLAHYVLLISLILLMNMTLKLSTKAPGCGGNSMKGALIMG